MLTDSSALGTQPGLSKEQKIGFILLLFFAFFTIGLGILQIRNTMLAPFALNNKITVAIKDQVNTLEALRYRDTDHDELNDFDELDIYGTSPYLYATFSYGLSDKEVIAIDPSGKLASGVYFVAASSDNNIFEKKIVIK